MKYYPNDIVEVINGHDLTIGHRYHVRTVGHPLYGSSGNVLVVEFGHNGCGQVMRRQLDLLSVRLYHRPWHNHLKAFFKR